VASNRTVINMINLETKKRPNRVAFVISRQYLVFKLVVVITLVSLIIPSIYLLPGCSSPAAKPENAGEISADLLQAVIDVDFKKIQKLFCLGIPESAWD